MRQTTEPIKTSKNWVDPSSGGELVRGRGDMMATFGETLPPAEVGAVWSPTLAVTEATSGQDRAVAHVIRLIPMTVIWMILAVALSIVVGLLADGVLAVVVGLVAFAGLTGFTYITADRSERDYSGAGLERYRITKAAELKKLEMQQAQELRRAALAAYLRWQEGGDRD